MYNVDVVEGLYNALFELLVVSCRSGSCGQMSLRFMFSSPSSFSSGKQHIVLPRPPPTTGKCSMWEMVCGFIAHTCATRGRNLGDLAREHLIGGLLRLPLASRLQSFRRYPSTMEFGVSFQVFVRMNEDGGAVNASFSEGDGNCPAAKQHPQG